MTTPLLLGVGPATNEVVGAGSTLTITLNGVTAGRSLVLGCGCFTSTNTITGITVSGESNMTLVGSPSTNATGNVMSQMAFLANVTTSGNKTIVITWSGSSSIRGGYVLEVQNGFVAAMVDNSGNYSNAGVTGANVSTTLTTIADNSGIFSFAQFDRSTTPITAGAGFTSAYGGGFSGGEYLLDEGTAGSKTVAYTHSTASLVAMANVSIAAFPPGTFLTAPPPTLVTGADGAILSAPPPTLSAGTNAAVLTAPPPTLFAGPINVCTAALSAPPPVLDAYTGHSAVLSAPAPTLDTYSGHSAALRAPVPVLVAGGLSGGIHTTDGLIASVPLLTATIVNQTLFVVQAVAPVPSLSSTVMVGTLSSALLMAPAPTLILSGLSGNALTAALAAPAPTLIATAYPANVITFSGTAPIPQLTAFLTAPVSVAFRTWVLNTRNYAVTEYGSEFAFNSYTLFQGQVLACGAGGVVVLGTQANDNGTPITARFRTGKSNYETSWQKRVPRIYADVSTDGDLIFRSITNEGGQRSYLLPHNFVSGIQQRRAPIGKGPRSTYFQFEIENVSGADFTVPALLVYPVKLRRRVS